MLMILKFVHTSNVRMVLTRDGQKTCFFQSCFFQGKKTVFFEKNSFFEKKHVFFDPFLFFS